VEEKKRIVEKRKAAKETVTNPYPDIR